MFTKQPEKTAEMALIEKLVYQLVQTNNSWYELARDLSEKLMAYTEEGRTWQRTAAEVNALQMELAETKERLARHGGNGVVHHVEPVIPNTQRWSDTDPPGGM